MMLWGKSSLVCLALLFGFVSAVSGDSNESSNGWEVLFDGGSTASWREIGSQDFPGDVWVVEDACLKLVPNREDGKDLISLKQYSDFDLTFEWKISAGGNSGIKYMVQERQLDPDRARLRKWAIASALCFLVFCGATYFLTSRGMKTLLISLFAGISIMCFYGAFRFSQPDGNAVGLEFQIYDDWGLKVPNKNISSGALYDLVAPAVNVVHRAGYFNKGRISVRGNHVEHWINGTKILDYELHSDDLAERIANSKFHEIPHFGQKSAGHISLQNHRDEIWFRSIRIRQTGSAVQDQW